jgi:hypothetical protein
MIVLFLLLMIIALVEQWCRIYKKSLIELLYPRYFADVTRFPEADFKCSSDTTCKQYDMIVERGYQKMKATKIVFTGLCINIEKKMPSLKKRLEFLGGFFEDYKIVIFENDSTDNTRALLLEWQKSNPNVYILPCPEDPDCKLKNKPAVSHGMFAEARMKKMADFRNRLLRAIRERNQEADCVCMMDLDIVGPISMDGVAHSFGLYEDWDSISGYGKTGLVVTGGMSVYYDYLAYKDEKFDINQNKSHIVPIFLKCLKHKRGDMPFKVLSGFAGIAFYKMHVINAGVTYTPKDGKYICEHIILHNNMIDMGFDRIYINPNMLVLIGPQGPKSQFFYY